MKITTKLPVAFLSIAIFVLIVGYFSANQSQKMLEMTITESATSLAQETLDKIDRKIYTRIEAIQVYFEEQLIKDIISDSNEEFNKLDDKQLFINDNEKAWSNLSKESITPFMQDLIDSKLSKKLRLIISSFRKKLDYDVFGEIFVTNKFGANIALSRKTSDYYQADEYWWQATKKDGLYIDNIQYDNSSNIYSIPISIRIDNELGEFLGIAKAVINIFEIFRIVEDVESGINYPNSGLNLFSGNGKLIYKTGEFQIYKNSIDEFNYNYADFINSINKKTYLNFNQTDDVNEKLYAHAHSKGYGDFNGLGWFLVSENIKNELFAPVAQLRHVLLIVSFVVALFAILLGLFVSRSIARPINILKDVTAKISKGSLDTKIKINSSNEIRDLADSFNRMIVDLKDTTVSKDYINSIISNMLDFLVVINPDGTIRTVNNATCISLEYKEIELLGKDLSVLFSGKGSSSKSTKLQKLLKNNSVANYESSFKTKNGIKLSVLISTSLIKEVNCANQGPLDDCSLFITKSVHCEKIQGIVLVAKDITERKKAEEAINASETRLRELYENMSSGVAVYEAVDDGENFIFKDLNRAGAELSKISKEEVIGLKVTEVFPGVTDFGLLDVFKNVLHTGTPQHHPISHYKDKRIEMWYENYVYKLPSGEIVAIYDDITARKNLDMEKENLQKQLFHAKKMEAIGTIASGIAHNFNNILASIRGRTEMAIAEISTDTRAFSDLTKVIKSIEIAKKLISQMMTFSRTQSLEIEEIEIAPIVMDAVSMFRAYVKGKIQIIENINTDCGLVLIDSQQIEHVILNLLTNSYHAIDSSNGIIEVALSRVKIDSNLFSRYPNLKNDEYIKLCIKDNGYGMDHATLERIFEPFFTTKELGQGTGLGLSMAHGIVTGCGGEIVAESELNIGTIFNIYLPCINQK